MKKIFILLFAALLLIACSKTTETKVENSTDKKSTEAYVRLIISKNSGSEILLDKKVAISGKKTAMQVLKENAEVIEEGGFIKSINGVASIPQNKLSEKDKASGILGYDWFILLNNEKANVVANDIILKDGDVLNFDFKGWTMKDLAP